MTEDTKQLRTEVRDLLLEFDQSLPPNDPDVARHAYRLRFALARVEEQSHGAVMESPLYTSTRFEVAMSILRFDIDRSRSFLHKLRGAAAQVGLVESPEVEATATKRAA